MSISALEIVKEFFIINGFYVTRKDNFLIVKNTKNKYKDIEEFIIEKEKVIFIDKAIIKVLAWHTLKFTPSVIKKFYSEIFEITEEKIYKKVKDLLVNNYKKILVIPGLPSNLSLRNESIKIMKEKGINNIILFPTVISGLIERIDERNLYQSQTLEIIRILKFYKFFSEKKFEKLLFEEK
ncbi:MAG: hypothetical protein NC833_01045 [Candidatus Omnitrophica bacterium]|nr:hypothetical protein [Candidatus Omnitrophota bacterium]